MAAVLSVSMAMAQAEFAWNVSADLVSAYIWRGQYCGGLSLQPDVSIGYEGEHSSLSVGAWGSVGVSDWKFVKNNVNETLNSFFNPELDIYLEFAFFGFHVGATHYYYFDGSPFFSGYKHPEGTSQTDVHVGYHFDDEFGIGLYLDAYTYILGADGVYLPTLENEEPQFSRYFSTYIELGYEIGLPREFTLTPAVGVTPNQHSAYADVAWSGWRNLGITNICLRLDKAWSLGNHFSLSVFALGSVNLNDIRRDNLWLNTSGEEKLGYAQKLNGCVGVNINLE